MNPPPPKTQAGGVQAVGILASDFCDPYMLRILQGALEELRRAKVSMVCFDGGFPAAPMFRNEEGMPTLPIPIDGWIVLTATLRSSMDDLERAVAATTRPIVSIGTELPSVPSIAANDETGVFQVVAHLVRRHGRKRIAFIGGPEESVDAARRREGYKMALESLNLEADPALFVAGDYEPRSGREAVRVLRRHTKLPFDAIVAANDFMAMGAIEALHASGVRVPEDVSVVGFDDTEEASFASPPLTTVRQPLYEQGGAAAREIVRALTGVPGDKNRTIGETPLVIRRSCGCRDSPPNPAQDLEVKKDQMLVEGALRERIRQELARVRQQREFSRLAGRILRAPDFPSLCQVMTDVTALLELRRMLVCSYAGAQRHARVALESTGRNTVFHHQSQSFAVEQVIPTTYLRYGPVELSVGPLELADEQLGYLVLDGDLQRSLAYLELRRHLGATLGRMAHGRELRRLYGERWRSGLESTPPPRKPT